MVVLLPPPVIVCNNSDCFVSHGGLYSFPIDSSVVDDSATASVADESLLFGLLLFGFVDDFAVLFVVVAVVVVAVVLVEDEEDIILSIIISSCRRRSHGAQYWLLSSWCVFEDVEDEDDERDESIGGFFSDPSMSLSLRPFVFFSLEFSFCVC